MPAPKYTVIAEDLAKQIRDHVMPPGSKLPSTRELMAIYGVSETVIRFVMVSLKAQGLVEGEPGRGVYVLPRS